MTLIIKNDLRRQSATAPNSENFLFTNANHNNHISSSDNNQISYLPNSISN